MIKGQPKRWVAVTALMVSAAINTILVVVIVTTNTHRINDIQRQNERIQQARVASCRLTYEGVRQVFQPFLPKNPDLRRSGRIRKFNLRIDELKAGCRAQTRPKGTR